MDHELADILNGNPFSSEVIQSWRDQLRQFNQGKIGAENLRFVLEDDEDRIADYASKQRHKHGQGEVTTFHFELLPDVYRGNPTAPVWILLLNPGFSMVDRYDHLGLCPICNERIVNAGANGIASHRSCITNWLGASFPDPAKALVKRQDMMLSQLSLDLKEKRNFFWFDEIFKTVPSDHAEIVGKGGYLWWKEFLFGVNGRDNSGYLLPKCGFCEEDAKKLGGKIFALELFPYHSINFSCGILGKKYCNQNKYLEFWNSLVSWAVRYDRKLIVRYKFIDRFLRKAIGDNLYKSKRANILCMASQKLALTINNIKGKKRIVNKQILIDGLCDVLHND